MFSRILDLDPDFWLELIKGSHETNLITFTEVHVAADCSENLMPMVNSAMKQGHYESGALQPRGFYLLNNAKQEGSLGKYSSNYATIKKRNLQIETLYFAEKRREGVSFAFYDKEVESWIFSVAAPKGTSFLVEEKKGTRAPDFINNVFIIFII